MFSSAQRDRSTFCARYFCALFLLDTCHQTQAVYFFHFTCITNPFENKSPMWVFFSTDFFDFLASKIPPLVLSVSRFHKFLQVRKGPRCDFLGSVRFLIFGPLVFYGFKISTVFANPKSSYFFQLLNNSHLSLTR